MLQLFSAMLKRIEESPRPLPKEIELLVYEHFGKSHAAKIFSIGLFKLYDADLKRIALLQIAGALVASERYRLATGKVPTRWDDIVPRYFPQIPTDPYDGKPLRWKNTPTGFILYSVWINGIDDGGVIKNSPLDAGLEYFAPAHRRQPALPVPADESKTPRDPAK